MTDLDGQIRRVRDHCGHASWAASNASRSFSANLPLLARDASALCSFVESLRQDLVALESRLFTIMLARTTKDNATWEANERAATANYKVGKLALLEQARADPTVARQLLAYEEEEASVGSNSSSPVVAAAAQGLASAFGAARSFLGGGGGGSGATAAGSAGGGLATSGGSGSEATATANANATAGRSGNGSGSTRGRISAMAANINATLRASIAHPNMDEFKNSSSELLSRMGTLLAHSTLVKVDAAGSVKQVAEETLEIDPPLTSLSATATAAAAATAAAPPAPSAPRVYAYQIASEAASSENKSTGALSPAANDTDAPPTDPYKGFVSVKDIVKKKYITVSSPIKAEAPTAAVSVAVVQPAPAPLLVSQVTAADADADAGGVGGGSKTDDAALSSSQSKPAAATPAKKGPGGRVAALASKFAKANTAKKTSTASAGGGVAKPDAAAAASDAAVADSAAVEADGDATGVTAAETELHSIGK